jgi:hypothetical protein
MAKTTKAATPAKQAGGPVAKTAKELTVTLPDKVGLTAEMSAAFAGAKINILAITGCSDEDGEATFTLLVDDAAKAKKVLRKLSAAVEDESVVTVEMPNKIGALQKVTHKIAEAGINIYYFYGTVGAGRISTVVFKTADDKKTVRTLNKA